ncbi:jg14355 [Pararge aegeria aegeria]|uniref:Jg14355 protein n=1 Tax=Pararge aegeria aegeria TaxID=348720 RepID=A0A8S4RDC1_9NEOP|nr:jg14355 [Pararge aegeria aegeria]
MIANHFAVRSPLVCGSHEMLTSSAVNEKTERHSPGNDKRTTLKDNMAGTRNGRDGGRRVTRGSVAAAPRRLAHAPRARSPTLARPQPPRPHPQ